MTGFSKLQLEAASKFLSQVLRHAPESIGLAMDAGGWVDIEELIERSAGDHPLRRELVTEVMATSAKQRFAVSAGGRRIRANQGHSIDVDLGLEPVTPPATLFHGTATRFLNSISGEGLRPGDRRHVHLSGDRQTAMDVGRRHGEPVALLIDSRAMHAEGLTFHLSDNGVWLTESVPGRFISRSG